MAEWLGFLWREENQRTWKNPFKQGQELNTTFDNMCSGIETERYVPITYRNCKYFSGLCRSLKFAMPVEGYALVGHVIKNLSIGVHASCKNLCTIESQCVSISIGPPINGKMVCELSNSDHKMHSEDLETKEGYIYRATQVRNLNLMFGFHLKTTTEQQMWQYEFVMGYLFTSSEPLFQ